MLLWLMSFDNNLNPRINIFLKMTTVIKIELNVNIWL
jgi:hypothetical protein